MIEEERLRLVTEIKLYGDLLRQLGAIQQHVNMCQNPHCGWNVTHVVACFNSAVDQGILIEGMIELYVTSTD